MLEYFSGLMLGYFTLASAEYVHNRHSKWLPNLAASAGYVLVIGYVSSVALATFLLLHYKLHYVPIASPIIAHLQSGQFHQWLLGAFSGILTYFFAKPILPMILAGHGSAVYQASKTRAIRWGSAITLLLMLAIVSQHGGRMLKYFSSLKTPLFELALKDSTGSGNQTILQFRPISENGANENFNSTSLESSALALMSRIPKQIPLDAMLATLHFSEGNKRLNTYFRNEADTFFPKFNKSNSNRDSATNDFAKMLHRVFKSPDITSDVMSKIMIPTVKCMTWIDNNIRYRPNLDPYIASLFINLRNLRANLNIDRYNNRHDGSTNDTWNDLIQLLIDIRQKLKDDRESILNIKTKRNNANGCSDILNEKRDYNSNNNWEVLIYLNAMESTYSNNLKTCESEYKSRGDEFVRNRCDNLEYLTANTSKNIADTIKKLAIDFDKEIDVNRPYLSMMTAYIALLHREYIASIIELDNWLNWNHEQNIAKKTSSDVENSPIDNRIIASNALVYSGRVAMNQSFLLSQMIGKYASYDPVLGALDRNNKIIYSAIPKSERALIEGGDFKCQKASLIARQFYLIYATNMANIGYFYAEHPTVEVDVLAVQFSKLKKLLNDTSWTCLSSEGGAQQQFQADVNHNLALLQMRIASEKIRSTPSAEKEIESHFLSAEKYARTAIHLHTASKEDEKSSNVEFVSFLQLTNKQSAAASRRKQYEHSLRTIVLALRKIGAK